MMPEIWSVVFLIPIIYDFPCSSLVLENILFDDHNSQLNYNVILIAANSTNITGCLPKKNYALTSLQNLSDLRLISVRGSAGPTLILIEVESYHVDEVFTQFQNFLNDQILWKTYWIPALVILLRSNKSNIVGNDELEIWASRFSADSQVYIFFWEILTDGSISLVSGVEIYSIKNVKIIGRLTLEERGDDREPLNFSFFAKLVETRVTRRLNFRGALITGITVENPDYEATIKYRHFNDSNNTLEFEDGFVVREFWYLRDALNFTEGAASWPTYLRQAPNGSLTGLAVPINFGLVDICIGYTEFLEYRMAAPNGITYLHPTFYNEIQVFFAQPAASSIRDIFLNTFTRDIWMALVGTWLLIILSFSMFVWIKQLSCEVLHMDDLLAYNGVGIWAIAAICQKGFYAPPSSISIRMIFLIGIIAGLLLYTAYSASLVSILSVEVVPVKRFRDLLKNSFEIFSDDHIPTAMAVVKSLENDGSISPLTRADGRNVDLADAIPNLVKSKSAIVSFTDSFDQVAVKRNPRGNFLCRKISKVLYRRRPAVASMFVKRGSPLREYFNCKIALMKERGVLMRLRSQYMDMTTVNCLNNGGAFKQRLALTDVFTAFLFLASGFIISFMFVFLERAFYFKRGSSRKLQ